MTLSICCATARPARAAIALAPLRRVADEIVVAVDISGGEQDLTALGGLADRLFEIELGTFPEPAMAWLHAQCAAEWILRIDDDELVGADLLEQLQELTRARDVLQYWLARRWLYPDGAHWLDEWPWFPDFQGRLVRNDAQLWFPGVSHSNVALALPARYIDSGLYHLVHLLSSRQQRERKVAGYLELDAPLRATIEDMSILSTYYVPENRPSIRSAAVDARDRDAIAAMIGHADAGSFRRGPAPPTQHASREEVTARWAERAIDDACYRGRIRPIDVHRRLLTGDPRPFRVHVSNEGSEWWPGGEDRRPLIRLAYHWLTLEGDVFQQEGIRTALPHPLAPGQSCVAAMNVAAPPLAGRYLLAPDLVHEYVRWFHCDSKLVEMHVASPDAQQR